MKQVCFADSGLLGEIAGSEGLFTSLAQQLHRRRQDGCPGLFAFHYPSSYFAGPSHWRSSVPGQWKTENLLAFSGLDPGVRPRSDLESTEEHFYL